MHITRFGNQRMNNLELILLALAILGALQLAAGGLRLIGLAVPHVWQLAQIPLTFVMRKFRVRVVERSFEGARLEGILNDVVLSLRSYVPDGWFVRGKIVWHTKRSITRLGDGTVILRIMPADRGDENVLNSLWYFVTASVFPTTKEKIQPRIVDGVSLVLVRNALEREHPALISDFDTYFLRSQIITDSAALEKFADFRKLDKFGLLFGPYVRELEACIQSDFNGLMPTDVSRIATSIEQFLSNFEPVRRRNLNDEDWIYLGEGDAFAILLVSKPETVRPSSKAYVRRARQFLNKGVKRIYLLGRNGEIEFLNEVAVQISEERELLGREYISLTNGYNGSGYGRGVIFEIDSVVEDLRLRSSVGSSEGLYLPIGQAESLLLRALVELEHGEYSWVFSGTVVQRMKKIDPQFKVTNYGFSQVKLLIEQLSSVDLEMRDMPNGAPSMYIKRVDDPQS